MGNIAHAKGTLAGIDIENTATASYQDAGGATVTIQSNTVTINVDELIDVLVSNTDAGDVITSPGAAQNVQKFEVTNNGNGNEAYGLSVNVSKGGDDFNPNLTSIVLDSNNNGVYDPGVDTVYVAGSNDPLLTPDQSITVFVITSSPSGINDAERAEVELTATAKTGTGTPGTSFAGAGQGGGNAIIGTTEGRATDSGFLLVSTADLIFNKSYTILDQFGGNKPIPGATITFRLVAQVNGTGTINNVVLSDNIPAGTTYVASSLSLETAALTDAADSDAGQFTGTAINVNAGNIPSGQSRTVTFKAVIQ
ncbi:DUF11 domain-containing protein [Sphingorhabdus lutea]|nr:DUF11 domain-containing protein [Sphingorhabdus lutea]